MKSNSNGCYTLPDWSIYIHHFHPLSQLLAALWSSQVQKRNLSVAPVIGIGYFVMMVITQVMPPMSPSVGHRYSDAPDACRSRFGSCFCLQKTRRRFFVKVGGLGVIDPFAKLRNWEFWEFSASKIVSNSVLVNVPQNCKPHLKNI